MHRNVTAIYRTYAVADLVRQRLLELGVADRHIHVIPDREEALPASGDQDDRRFSDRLHDLHLPDEDLRTYQHSVRRGDYVVSVEIDDDSTLARAQEVMRRPEEETYATTAGAPSSGTKGSSRGPTLRRRCRRTSVLNAIPTM